jgi:hypothetical protein
MKSTLKTLGLALSCCFSFAVSAQQSKIQQDKEAIKSMCGCYRITFDYAETFPNDTGYKIHEPYHAVAPAEWIFVEEESDNNIVIQHLLVINDTTIVKHWRQDWKYENTALYNFDKDRRWNYQQLDPKAVKGQWTQNVFQVDDSPRYQGSASWVHVDGKHYWENTTDAPLPRREFSKRSDYNVMQRTNRHVLTATGWLHEQDNLKIIRENGKDSILVAEKGLNNYIKIDESHCQAGKDWWTNNQAYWKLVRAEWDRLFALNKDITLTKKVGDKMLWQSLFELGGKMTETAEKDPKKASSEINAVINQYLSSTKVGMTD